MDDFAARVQMVEAPKNLQRSTKAEGGVEDAQVFLTVCISRMEFKVM